ncbi:MAG: hypothetical protein AMJ73_04350 [candidate division Zixibacteria bacterium SM1_73]|nr:MAG: hypothetical protein AMJ73_04350 [candidate division Zixibacteria bacterium SM1_73]
MHEASGLVPGESEKFRDFVLNAENDSYLICYKCSVFLGSENIFVVREKAQIFRMLQEGEKNKIEGQDLRQC